MMSRQDTCQKMPNQQKKEHNQNISTQGCIWNITKF